MTDFLTLLVERLPYMVDVCRQNHECEHIESGMGISRFNWLRPTSYL